MLPSRCHEAGTVTHKPTAVTHSDRTAAEGALFAVGLEAPVVLGALCAMAGTMLAQRRAMRTTFIFPLFPLDGRLCRVKGVLQLARQMVAFLVGGEGAAAHVSAIGLDG